MTVTKEFMDKYNVLMWFINTYNRLPNRLSNSAERQLYFWLMCNKKMYINNKLDSNEAIMLFSGNTYKTLNSLGFRLDNINTNLDNEYIFELSKLGIRTESELLDYYLGCLSGNKRMQLKWHKLVRNTNGNSRILGCIKKVYKRAEQMIPRGCISIAKAIINSDKQENIYTVHQLAYNIARFNSEILSLLPYRDSNIFIDYFYNRLDTYTLCINYNLTLEELDKVISDIINYLKSSLIYPILKGKRVSNIVIAKYGGNKHWRKSYKVYGADKNLVDKITNIERFNHDIQWASNAEIFGMIYTNTLGRLDKINLMQLEKFCISNNIRDIYNFIFNRFNKEVYIDSTRDIKSTDMIRSEKIVFNWLTPYMNKRTLLKDTSLSIRIVNILANNNIRTVQKLVKHLNNIDSISGIGKQYSIEIRNLFNKFMGVNWSD